MSTKYLRKFLLLVHGRGAVIQLFEVIC